MKQQNSNKKHTKNLSLKKILLENQCKSNITLNNIIPISDKVFYIYHDKEEKKYSIDCSDLFE